MKVQTTPAWALAIAAQLAAPLAAHGGDYCVVDTGQTQCYDANDEIAAPLERQPFYGQDAQCHGNLPGYTLSGDGPTVYDNVTGLTWIA
jgi:hypothetical protein